MSNFIFFVIGAFGIVLWLHRIGDPPLPAVFGFIGCFFAYLAFDNPHDPDSY